MTLNRVRKGEKLEIDHQVYNDIVDRFKSDRATGGSLNGHTTSRVSSVWGVSTVIQCEYAYNYDRFSQNKADGWYPPLKAGETVLILSLIHI